MRHVPRSRVLAVVLAVTALWPGTTRVAAEPPDPELIATIEVGDGPALVRADPVHDRVYVSNGFDGSVSVIDGATHAVVATLPFGAWDVALNPLTNRVYVPDPEAGAIRVVDGETLAVLATIFTDADASLMAADPFTRKVYATDTYADRVLVIDGETNTVVGTIPVGDGPFFIEVNPLSRRVYTFDYTGESVSVIDGATDRLLATVPLPDMKIALDPMRLNPLTEQLYVLGDDGIHVIDGASGTLLPMFPTGRFPEAVDVNLSSNRVYVARDRSVTVMDGFSGAVIDDVYFFCPPGEECPTVPRSVCRLAVDRLANRVHGGVCAYGPHVRRFDGRTHSVGPFVPLREGYRDMQPNWMALNPFTDRLYVTHQGADRVSVIAGYRPAMFEPVVEILGLLRELIERVRAADRTVVPALEDALRVLEDPDPTRHAGAVHHLAAFIDAVESRGGAGIPEERADEWVGVAQRIVVLMLGGWGGLRTRINC
jgi:YVTN family beta-propeller protein